LFPDFDTERPEEIENKNGLKIEKEYSERKQPLSLWTGEASYIKDRMYEYIGYVKQPENYNIKDAKLRIQLLRDTDIDNDQIIIDFLSSGAWINKCHKTKKDRFTDQNFSYPASYLCSYVIHPDRKLHNILTSEQQKNRGRTYEEREDITYDEHGNEIVATYTVKRSFKRDISVDEVYEPQTSHNFIGTGDNKKQLHNDVSRYTDISSVKLSDPKHVRVLLERYSEWRQDIQEQGNIDEEFSELLDRLDLIIENTNFSQTEMFIISLVKQSEYNYKQILELVNNKFGNVYTYKQVNYAITESIPNKISRVAARINKAMNSSINT